MRRYDDMIFIALPRHASPHGPDGELVVPYVGQLFSKLTEMAAEELYRGYPYARLLSMEWDMLYTVEEAVNLELAHQCADCQEGKDKSIILLASDPNVFVCVGVLHCEEPS